ncbi:MAG: hypothetical protein ACR650_04425 [Methylocystis sp.]
MQIPEAFLKLTTYFHQDIDLIYPTGEGVIEDALAALTSKERNVVKTYLVDLVSGRYDEKQLRAIWRSAKADISPFRGNEGDCKGFLGYILSKISD